MKFLQSTKNDLETIFELYDAAIAHQKAVSLMHWLPFDRLMVEAEIAEGRQWKIVLDGEEMDECTDVPIARNGLLYSTEHEVSVRYAVEEGA